MKEINFYKPKSKVSKENYHHNESKSKKYFLKIVTILSKNGLIPNSIVKLSKKEKAPTLKTFIMKFTAR